MSARPAFRSSLSWLMAERFLRVAAAVPVTLLVARYLGPDDFGRLGIGLGLVGLAMLMTQLGLDRVLRRDLAERPAESGALLGTGVGLMLCAALIAVGVMSLYAIHATADPVTRKVLLILTWAVLPQVLAPAEYWFHSTGHPGYSVTARTVVLVACAVLRIAGCALGWDVAAFAWIALVEWTLGGIAIAALLVGRPEAPHRLNWCNATAARWIREAWPVFLMLLLGAGLERVDLLVLQQLAETNQLGYYAAAQRFSEFWWSLSVTLGAAVVPFLTRIRVADSARFNCVIQRYLDASMGMTVLVAIAVTLVAPWALPLLLGRQYAESVPVLCLLCWAAPAVYAEVARSQYLLIERKLHVDVIFNVTHAVLGIALSIWFVPRWGATGAGVARLLGFYAVAWVFPWFFESTRDVARMQWKSFAFFLRWRELWRSAEQLLAFRRLRKPQEEAAVTVPTASR